LTTVPFSFAVILWFCFLKIREFSKNRIGCSEGEKSRFLGSKFREFREYNAGIFTGMARLH
jgi:hypothetical protein